ncbi:NnrS family protein [Sedimenticola sp.]|uniref:NnrS family protein n=1 Tax=Sedimenticola sp. TaxID=1940285 RepID=UPI003D151F6D
MIISPQEKKHYRIAISHLGFRPFFLLGSLYGAIAMALWLLTMQFNLQFDAINRIGAINWHGHEMIYGYGMAVIGGFLLTAVRNWTSIQTLHGTGLIVLALFWLLARIALLIPGENYLWLAAVCDLVFNLWLCAALIQPIVKVRQWAQVGLLSKVILLAASNALFYAELLYGMENGIRWSLYSGIYLIISLILLMGRRVIPFFIERGVGYMVSLRNRNWVDRSNLIAMLVFWVVAVFTPYTTVAGVLALALSMLQGIRLYDWHTPGIWKKPLVWVLYLAYIWLTLGFLLTALALFGLIDGKPALHALSVGGIGMVTMGMMARVAYGHTGRNVFEPPRYLGPLFALLFTAAVIRVFGALFDMNHYLLWIGSSQLLWIIALGGFGLLYAPLLIKPRVDGSYG